MWPKILIVTLFSVVTTLTAVSSLAGQFPVPSSSFEYAPVEHVEPMTRIVQIPVAREECWEQPVTHYSPRAHSYTPTIAGGIIGAVVGHQFGSGSGQDWATVAGTTLGASIGRDYGQRRAAYATTQIEQRCRVVNDYQEEERADGFLVTYTYNGHQYETKTAHHPGDRIKVRVDVTPVP